MSACRGGGGGGRRAPGWQSSALRARCPRELPWKGNIRNSRPCQPQQWRVPRRDLGAPGEPRWFDKGGKTGCAECCVTATAVPRVKLGLRKCPYLQTNKQAIKVCRVFRSAFQREQNKGKANIKSPVPLPSREGSPFFSGTSRAPGENK